MSETFGTVRPGWGFGMHYVNKGHENYKTKSFSCLTESSEVVHCDVQTNRIILFLHRYQKKIHQSGTTETKQADRLRLRSGQTSQII